MGIADIRAAFNAVGEPAGFTCSQAFMDMTNLDGKEWQILTFWGRKADGYMFNIKSDLVPAGGDLSAAARKAAQTLIDGAPKP